MVSQLSRTDFWAVFLFVLTETFEPFANKLNMEILKVWLLKMSAILQLKSPFHWKLYFHWKWHKEKSLVSGNDKREMTYDIDHRRSYEDLICHKTNQHVNRSPANRQSLSWMHDTESGRRQILMHRIIGFVYLKIHSKFTKQKSNKKEKTDDANTIVWINIFNLYQLQ